MGTVIELISCDRMKNIASLLSYPDDHYIYVGTAELLNDRCRGELNRFYIARGRSRMPEYYVVPEGDFPALLKQLEALLLAHPGCRLELTGGGEKLILAMGMLVERHRTPVFRVDFKTGKPYSVMGTLPRDTPTALSAKQLITLFGGSLLSAASDSIPDDALVRRYVNTLWEYSRLAPSMLTKTADFLNRLPCSSGLAQTCLCPPLSPSLKKGLQSLVSNGLLREFSLKSGNIHLEYTDAMSKKLLTTGGLTLELALRFAAVDSHRFDDVCQGVVLDWDGVETLGPAVETRNEVDLLCIRGLQTLFVSCKSGIVKKEALYELETVASHFGGESAVKRLVCGKLTGTSREAIVRRSRELGIELMDDIFSRSVNELADCLTL